MGLDFTAVSEAQTVEHVLSGVTEGRGGWVCAVNLDVLRQWRESADVRNLMSSAELVVADGMPLIWAGAIAGLSPAPARGRLDADPLAPAAAAARAAPPSSCSAAIRAWRIAAARRLRGAAILPARSPARCCPPLGFEHDAAMADRIERRSGPITRHRLRRARLPEAGAADRAAPGARCPRRGSCRRGDHRFAAGEFKRAPVWVQRARPGVAAPPGPGAAPAVPPVHDRGAPVPCRAARPPMSAPGRLPVVPDDARHPRQGAAAGQLRRRRHRRRRRSRRRRAGSC